ncbi:elongation factor Ts [Halomonas sp. S2151]|mgnify:CR=1 FL=1|uniref:Elongation factor Ts n=2 Tax=Halomonas TaxID=2745 RepID=A0AAU7KS54_9GAMM|nr:MULTISPECIES: translation elongation factor Ts [Halomonas]MBR9881506.1 elongation factor Ts [Gammaproteobacteria bacterium]KJZ17762.1 elongation factor Ts [Halomonas sp. S2151]MBS8268774.1 elongation factor Ts [Halomonas litopenaei]MBY5943223.1 translation elongation factor Ts [Halomonas sp. DP5N14-9]MBY6110371.1 translation elongation factor Ts [Halomonas sp. DP1Y21-3]|tara:strand:+ start:2459 stop:3328 length:870 start_codon:yes stop_codon:yes gene_type:complete
MAAISASQVKELRERTGLGMMECKKALTEAGGDIEQAIEDLRKNSGLKAAKKAGRTAAEGVVVTRVAEDGAYGVMVEINSETDFVARDDNFKAFADKIADAFFAAKSDDVAAVTEGELETAREQLVQKIGENIGVRRAVVVDAAEGNLVGAYVHGGRIGVLTELKGGTQEAAKDVSMHVAAINPTVARPEDMPQSALDEEKAIILAQPDMAGKPEQIAEKMVQGRLKKYLAENSLTEQPFVKDPNQSVAEFVKAAGGEVVGFTRFEVGEGIEKEEVDFAKEVMEQAKRS